MYLITAAGYVGRDAEMRFTPDGKQVCSFSLGVRLYKGDTEWVDCTLWGKMAESIGPHIKKGSGVVVSGTPKVEVWKGKQDGEPRGKINITVSKFTFMGKAGGNAQPDQLPAEKPDSNQAELGDTIDLDEDTDFF